MCSAIDSRFEFIQPAEYEKGGTIGEHKNAVIIVFDESEKEIFDRITTNETKSYEICIKLYEKLKAMVVLVQRNNDSISLYNEFCLSFEADFETYVEYYSQLKRRLRNDFYFFEDDLYCS